MTGESRIERRFSSLRKQGRSGLVVFVTAGDPTLDISRNILVGLPGAGADLIEIGMPFSDPMADGPAIQLSSQRALANGHTMARTLALVRDLRVGDNDTPVILMGYYNPIHAYGVDDFIRDAIKAGVDGLIVVDLPPEEEAEFSLPAIEAGLTMIYLAAPTTTDERLPSVLRHASGFLYFVSITGITGTREVDADTVRGHVERIRRSTDMPIAVGFGIRNPDQAQAIAEIADAAVVGSAVVNVIADHLDENGTPTGRPVDKVLAFVGELASGMRRARQRKRTG